MLTGHVILRPVHAQEDNVSKAREQLQQLNTELDTLKDFITTSQVGTGADKQPLVLLLHTSLMHNAAGEPGKAVQS